MRRPAFVSLVAVGLASLAASTQYPEEMFVPGTTYPNCGGMNPVFEFRREDFQKGFKQTYTFPGTIRCELGQLGDRGGTITLTYTPGPLASLHAVLDYWEVLDCSDNEDEPRSAKYSYSWSGELQPNGTDPDGVFPAASFGRTVSFAQPSSAGARTTMPAKLVVSGNCDGEPNPPPKSIYVRVGLVSPNRETGVVHRSAYVLLRGSGVGVLGEIAFAGRPDESELEVDVQPSSAYDTWMPAGNLGAPTQPGNELRVKAKVRQKGDPASRGKARLRFAFDEVSREKGVCLNWPANDADTKPDLRLRFADPALGAASADGTSIETNGLVEEAELIVDAYDFGAWGALRISGEDKNKRNVAVKFRGRQTPHVRIPLDEDANRIADAWTPAGGRSGDEDDEHVAGNEYDGDGLTLYEEYRGLVEAGARLQPDPTKKDLFVLNLAGEDALMGLSLFKEATKLEVHAKFSRTELDPFERLINRYSSVGFPQHGVVIEWWDSDPGFSKAIGGPGTPIDVSPIKLSRSKLAEVEALPGKAYAGADVEVAHELAHAVNVFHHGEGDWEKTRWFPGKSVGEILEVRERGDDPHPVRVFLDDGRRLTPEQADDHPVWLGRQGGQHSGADLCLMRYSRAGLLAYVDRSQPDKRVLYTGPRQVGVELCRSADGTGVNAKGRRPQPAWGDASPGRGDCFGQIAVKDRGQSRR